MTSITLRPRQQRGKTNIIDAWNSGVQNVMFVYPTGGGKSFIMSDIARDAMRSGEVCFVLAHRNVLVSQLSNSLCQMQIQHTFIAAKKTITDVTNANHQEYGNSYYNKLSTVIVVSVDTMLRKLNESQMIPIFQRTKYWLMDEGHHCLADNKWGQCVAPLKNAKGALFTATPIRADKKGLGRHADGVADTLIVGGTQGELMAEGSLSLYKIYSPPIKLNMEGVKLTNSGDWNQKELAKRTDRSDITGDAVEHYFKYANGLQAITFCVNIAHSDHVAEQFNKAGVSSVSLSSKTPTTELIQALKDFRAGRYQNLVNCDLFGEGFDVPAVATVIMLRKTESYSLFKQQFGRCLRPFEGKTYGILLDHVGNVKRHCLHGAPHDDPEWTLDRQAKRNDDGERSTSRICPECFNYYTPKTANQFICPECAHEETKEEINKAEQDFQHEEGELVELSIDFVNELLMKRKEVDMPVQYVRAKYEHLPNTIKMAQVNTHVRRQYAQDSLRTNIQLWCQKNNPDHVYDVETVRGMFQLRFGTHIFAAQVLSERLAMELTERIKGDL
jgi:DNA repair protein RadD